MCVMYIYLLFSELNDYIECETRGINNRENFRSTYKQIYGQVEKRFELWDTKAEEALGYPSREKLDSITLKVK